jgi:recombination protein RecR
MVDVYAIEALKKALRRLPGVGPKTARRMAFHLLERDREGAKEIAAAINQAVQTVAHCRRCNTLSETDLCDICASTKRDDALLCVVETPADLESVEQAGVYGGKYFVLMGHISPLDGIGPDDLGIDRFQQLLSEGNISEVIVATNLTVEGEATAEYIRQITDTLDVKVTRLARGVPVGGELEYMDHGTLAQAFNDRRSI